MERVLEQFRCPGCLERRVDYLVSDADSGDVTCLNCGAIYDPLREQEG